MEGPKANRFEPPVDVALANGAGAGVAPLPVPPRAFAKLDGVAVEEGPLDLAGPKLNALFCVGAAGAALDGLDVAEVAGAEGAKENPEEAAGAAEGVEAPDAGA